MSWFAVLPDVIPYMPAMVDREHGDRISVIGALGMSVEEFESESSNIEFVNELEMVCFSDREHSEDSTVTSNSQLNEAADFSQEQSDKCNIGSELESGPSYEVQSMEAAGNELELGSVRLDEEDVSVPQLIMKQQRSVFDKIISKSLNSDDMKAKVMLVNHCVFSCDICEKQFAKESVLKSHMASHVKRHSCCYCSKTFQYRSQLVLHTNMHTTNVAVTGVHFSCDVCKREFRSSPGLRKHRRVHSDIQQHRCPICSKTFAFPSVLAEHERIHSAVCPFICDFCGRGFKHTSNMLKHRRLLHELPGVSSCQRCGPSTQCVCSGKDKSSSQSSTCSRFQCPVCLKCFTNKSYKEMHIRVHTGERPYKCQVGIYDSIGF